MNEKKKRLISSQGDETKSIPVNLSMIINHLLTELFRKDIELRVSLEIE